RDIQLRRREEYRLTARPEVVDELETALDDEGSASEGELVDHEHLGPVDEDAREREHLLLTTREAPAELLAALGQLGEEDHHLVDVRRDLALALRHEMRAQNEVLLDGEVGEDAFAAGEQQDAELDP